MKLMESDGSPEASDLQLGGQLMLRLGGCRRPEAQGLS